MGDVVGERGMRRDGVGGRGGMWGALVELQKSGSALGGMELGGASTIDTYAVAQMGIGEYVRAVGNGKRCSTSTTGGLIVLLKGGDSWLVLVS